MDKFEYKKDKNAKFFHRFNKPTNDEIDNEIDDENDRKSSEQ